MPIFLRTIGFSFLLIGVLEGFAEATAGLSKSYFGKMSDKTGKRLPFVQLGYLLSAVSKPLMAAFIFPVWIYFVRTLDRIGKGIRTGARDAMLNDEATPATKGRVFGFHRSMDSFGAVIGPAIALLYLVFHPKDYRTLFVIAFIPGILAIASTLFLEEKTKPLAPKKIIGLNFFVFANYWKNSPTAYKKIVAGLVVFALFNSADVFLLLQMKTNGMNDTALIGVYIFYNLLYAMLAYPIGVLADKIGLKKILIVGLLVFSVVYGGFSIVQPLSIYILLFALYAFYAAATEGISKAMISNSVSTSEVATAIGTYSGFQSVASFFASSIAGFVWYKFGASVIFLLTSMVSISVAIYFLSLKNVTPKQAS